MSYQIIWTNAQVEWNHYGTVTGSEIIQSNKEIYGDPRFDDLRSQLVDLSAAERFEISEKEMRYVAYLDAAAARSNSRIRVAVVATDENARQAYHDYVGNIKKPVWEYKLFDNREAAQDWLDL